MINIPCDTIARLSNLIPKPGADVEDIFRTFRLDNGCIIATNRQFAAVEQLHPFEGVHHISATDELIQVCTKEAPFGSTLQVLPNDVIKWTTVRTTLGYEFKVSIGVYPPAPTTYDQWYDLIVVPVLKGEPVSNGAMATNITNLSALAASSPSGDVVFEEFIDVRRPTMMRDANDPRWCGFWMPRAPGSMYATPARVPQWLERGA